MRSTFFGEWKNSCSSKSCYLRSVLCNAVFKIKKIVYLKVIVLYYVYHVLRCTNSCISNCIFDARNYEIRTFWLTSFKVHQFVVRALKKRLLILFSFMVSNSANSSTLFFSNIWHPGLLDSSVFNYLLKYKYFSKKRASQVTIYQKTCISRFSGPYSKTCIVEVPAAWGRVSRGLTVLKTTKFFLQSLEWKKIINLCGSINFIEIYNPLLGFSCCESI